MNFLCFVGIRCPEKQFYNVASHPILGGCILRSVKNRLVFVKGVRKIGITRYSDSS